MCICVCVYYIHVYTDIHHWALGHKGLPQHLLASQRGVVEDGREKQPLCHGIGEKMLRDSGQSK